MHLSISRWIGEERSSLSVGLSVALWHASLGLSTVLLVCHGQAVSMVTRRFAVYVLLFSSIDA